MRIGPHGSPLIVDKLIYSQERLLQPEIILRGIYINEVSKVMNRRPTLGLALSDVNVSSSSYCGKRTPSPNKYRDDRITGMIRRGCDDISGYGAKALSNRCRIEHNW